MKPVYLVEDLQDPETPYVYFDESFLELTNSRYGRVMIVEFKPTHTINVPKPTVPSLQPIRKATKKATKGKR